MSYVDDLEFRHNLYTRYISIRESAAEVSVINRKDHRYQGRYLPLLSELPRESLILELGCGQGHLLKFLRDQGFSKANGIDVSGEQILCAKQKGLDVKQMDVFEALDGVHSVYDAVIAIDFVEHFTRAELFELVPIIYTALKPGGRLILQTPNGQGLFPHQVIYGDLTHLSVFSPTSLTQLLSYMHFEKIQFWETAAVPRNLRSAVKFIMWQIIKFCVNMCRRIETGKRQDIWTENMLCLCFKPMSDKKKEKMDILSHF